MSQSTIHQANNHRNALPIGSQLDVYRIEKLLGHGGFGMTYYAIDCKLEKPFAIKEFLPQEHAVREHDMTVQAKSTADEEAYNWGLKCFLQEAKTLASINHTNIVKAVRFFQANNTAYLVMEYEQGESLDIYLKTYGKPLPEQLIKDVFNPLLDGLHAVHKKDLLHRDIKPANIYLRQSASPMLIDFGAARYALGEHSRSLSVCLTPGYAPHEQYSSRGKQGAWTDLYGVGASLYKCMTGKIPVSAEDRAQSLLDDEADPYLPVSTVTSGKYSSELCRLVDTALAFKAKDRPQTIKQFKKSFVNNNVGPDANKDVHSDENVVRSLPINEEKNYSQAIDWYYKEAERGNTDAQYNLGLMYANGEDVAKDSDQAMSWFRKAADQGDVEAQYSLGCIYHLTNRSYRNLHFAREWYSMAADQGYAKAQYNLGWMAYRDHDKVQAMNWWCMAADQGYVYAQFNLGWVYANGEGVKKNLDIALSWYRKAEDQGNVRAQNNLGWIYATGGKGVKKNLDIAMSWWRKAVDQGSARAQYNLGWMYTNGKGVTKDSILAIDWYRRAADQGIVKAQNNLGWMYANGRGVTKDSVLAMSWYRKAANQGYVKAQISLGWMYAYGKGVTKDFFLATSWHDKAKYDGNRKEIVRRPVYLEDLINWPYNLGSLYFKGLYISNDPDQSGIIGSGGLRNRARQSG